MWVTAALVALAGAITLAAQPAAPVDRHDWPAGRRHRAAASTAWISSASVIRSHRSRAEGRHAGVLPLRRLVTLLQDAARGAARPLRGHHEAGPRPGRDQLRPAGDAEEVRRLARHHVSAALRSRLRDHQALRPAQRAPSIRKSRTYGIPHPGTFIVDRKGVVSSRFFEDAYQERYTAATILSTMGGVIRAPSSPRPPPISPCQLAYVYVPNTGQGGYESFNRYYFAQQDKKGAIVDERYNGGGSAADYIVDVLGRDFDGYFNNVAGDRMPFTSPSAGIWGPKVMIINEMAGSGGDLMPYMFKRRKIGPLVGKRTWGGLVHTADTPGFIDGGSMIAPRGGFFTRDGKWAVENEGVGAGHRRRELAQGRHRRQGPAARARRRGGDEAAQGAARQSHDHRAAVPGVGEAEGRTVARTGHVELAIPGRGRRHRRLPRPSQSALRRAPGDSPAPVVWLRDSLRHLWPGVLGLRRNGGGHRLSRAGSGLGGLVADAGAPARPRASRHVLPRPFPTRCPTARTSSGSTMRAFSMPRRAPKRARPTPASSIVEHARSAAGLHQPDPGHRHSAPPRVHGRRGHFCSATARPERRTTLIFQPFGPVLGVSSHYRVGCFPAHDLSAID